MHTVVSSNPPYYLYPSLLAPAPPGVSPSWQEESRSPLVDVGVLARTRVRARIRYEFHHVARDAREDGDEDVLRDARRKKDPEGRLIRFYSPAAGRERARLWSKNVTCVRQSRAKSDAALRSPGNSKEIYVPPRDPTGKKDKSETFERNVRLRKAFNLQVDELIRTNIQS